MSPLTAIILATGAVHAAVAPTHKSEIDGTLSLNKWYHEDDHPVHALFKRGPVSDGLSYYEVGTPEWSAGFPQGVADTTSIPQAWVDALNAAVDAGKIPDVPLSTESGGLDTVYPVGYDPTSQAVCSSGSDCAAPGDLWDAPEGVVGLSFDDGPQPPSQQLYEFLASKSEHATHFFIGTNILQYPDLFKIAFETNQDDIAVHTWTHPFMTTKTNIEILGELGWTMELIHNSTGGRVPKYWRPPYGDSDMRVRAIANEVFGLKTVIWSQDTLDWSLTESNPLTSPEKIQQQMITWLTGSKNPGLIILEHELSDQSVQAFMDAYPLMVSNGWKRTSVAQLDGGSAYQNTWNSPSQINPAKVGGLTVEARPVNSSTTSTTGSPTSSGKHSSSTSNQKSGASHFSVAPLALTGIVTVIAAAAVGFVVA